MKIRDIDGVYRAFGDRVRMHRKQRKGLTQEKLGQLVGLSRTSITNIEKGRQHVSLHQLFDIAEALRVRADALLPSVHEASRNSTIVKKLPPGTEQEIAEWAGKIAGD